MAADPEVPALQEITEYIGNIIEALIPLVGMISFIMILVGGFTLLTSNGQPELIKKGQKTITFAIGGLIMAIASWLVLVLIRNITGVNVTEFRLGF